MNVAGYDSRILRGMDKLLKLRQGRLDAGDKAIGWKVGFGAPASLEALRLDAPLVGFLTDKVLLDSGSALSIAGWTKPAAEPEIAVYLNRDLPGVSDRETIQAAISAIGPAIEIADVHFPPNDVEAILAGNIYNRHVILGKSDNSRAGCTLDGLVGRIYRNGQEIATVTDLQVLTGNFIGIVQHVANLLASLGQMLRSGDVIITGSIVPPLWIERDEEIRFDLDPIDKLTIRLEN
ncbi:MAG TPA: fumarylacetoacetate hydrolase family protein [Anaerolineales bacterium]